MAYPTDHTDTISATDHTHTLKTLTQEAASNETERNVRKIRKLFKSRFNLVKNSYKSLLNLVARGEEFVLEALVLLELGKIPPHNEGEPALVLQFGIEPLTLRPSALWSRGFRVQMIRS